MALIYDLKNKFKNTKIIYVNSLVKVNFKDVYQDMVVFRDENYNVNSINYFSRILSKDKKIFGVLTPLLFKKIKNKVLKNNNKYLLKKENYFLIGKIIKRETHPKSDHLFILNVDFGNQKIKQIVTNTTYTTKNKFFVFAMPGSITAQGLEIKKSQVLNIESYGMLATGKSLGIDDSAKIFEGNMELKINDLEHKKGKNVEEVFPEIYWS